MSAPDACRSHVGRSGLRSRFRVEHVLVVCGAALLPWLVALACGGLPGTGGPEGNAVWIGLDTLEALGLVATGLTALRGHPVRALTATATATLLVVDAWFDTMTAAPGEEQVWAAVMAVGAELPLAAVCVRLAMRAAYGPRH